MARQCWQVVMPNIQLQIHSEFGGWLQEVMRSVSEKKRAEIATTCWAIWRARNDVVWNHKRSQVNKIVAAAKQYLVQWRCAQDRVIYIQPSSMQEGDGAFSWVVPQENIIKITVDAAVFEDQSAYGLCLVARNSDGQLLQGRMRCLQERVAPEFADVMAVKKALSWCQQSDWLRVEIETDCLAVVQAIRSSVRMFSPFGEIVEYCPGILKSLSNVKLHFIRRSATRICSGIIFISRSRC